jgi:NAD(P)-dependent dehydrogenase (short-subunit alcohol dehydrogenase family)
MPPAFKADVFAQAQRTLPVKRVGKPEDVAAAIVMLAANEFITGTIVDVSGGGTLAR